MAKCAVNDCHMSGFADSVVVDLTIFVRNRAVWADFFTGCTSITEQRIGFCCTRVGGQFVFCQQSDYFDSSSPCLCNGLRDIFRSLAYAGEEDTCGRGLYRTQFCVCLSKEIVLFALNIDLF